MTTSREKLLFARTLKSARLGLPDAQYEVGLMYANGVGAPQDFKQAIHWIRLSAERGHVPAQYLLATRYASGVAIEKSETQAFHWFQRAAAQGHPKAHFRLGRLHAVPQAEAAFSSYLKAAELGLAEAQLAVAEALVKGQGVAQDLGRAWGWAYKAAEQGLAMAQHRLGDMYLHGQGVAPDAEQAFLWYRRAAAQRYAPAQVAMELLESRDASLPTGRSGARRKRGGAERRQAQSSDWTAAAEHGDANAWYHLGLMFAQGLGVPADVEQAEHWYLRAAQAGDARAQLGLAELLADRQAPGAGDWYLRAAEQEQSAAQLALARRFTETAHGGLRDPMLGLAWYLRAGEQKDALSWRELAQLLESNAPELVQQSYRKAADAGDAHAQYVLAQQYAVGGAGVAQDAVAAFRWYQLAAEQGHKEAQSALGACYLAGNGVERDLQQALHWLLKAAEQGDPKAQWNLGAVYTSGQDGLKRDLPLAFRWCQKAAAAGFVPAQATLGVMFAKAKDFEQSALWLHKAAAQGDAEAQYNLANAYIKGLGVPADLHQSFAWMVSAAEQGIPQAQSRLGLMFATGEGGVLDPVEAHKWLLIAAQAGDLTAKPNLKRSEILLGLAQIREAKRRVDAWLKVSAYKHIKS